MHVHRELCTRRVSAGWKQSLRMFQGREGICSTARTGCNSDCFNQGAGSPVPVDFWAHDLAVRHRDLAYLDIPPGRGGEDNRFAFLFCSPSRGM